MTTKKPSPFVGASLLLYTALAIHSQVVACDCLPITEEDSFARADQVFTGRVVAVHRIPEGPDAWLEVHFDVEDSEKGEVANRTIVYTGEDTGGCGYPMAKYLRYRVFATEFEDGRLITGLCSNNSLVPETNDRDVDGIPDLWEEQHGFDPENPSDAREDVDGDSLNAHAEYLHGTNPSLPDTDGDGFLDGLETSFHTDPLDPESPGKKSIPLSPDMMEHVIRWKRLEFSFDIPPFYQLGFQSSTDLERWRAHRITIRGDEASTKSVLKQGTVFYRAVLTPLPDFYVLTKTRGDSRLRDGSAIQITEEPPEALQLAPFVLNDAWILDDDLILSLEHQRAFTGQEVQVYMDKSHSGAGPVNVNLYVQLPELDTASANYRWNVRFDLSPVTALVGDHDIRLKVHGHFSTELRDAPTEVVRLVRE